jgi:hypothetical protein
MGVFSYTDTDNPTNTTTIQLSKETPYPNLLTLSGKSSLAFLKDNDTLTFKN